MKWKLFVVVLFVIVSALSSNLNASIIPWPAKSKIIVQTVDHFNFGPSTLQFKQKYLYEDKWYKVGGPIFFYCGNEGPIESFWNNTGLIFELAQKFNAIVIFGEHRYYGVSLPFGPVESFKQPKISYLSIEQAMADYVFLLNSIKESNPKLNNSKVIAFGGSYGGMLAAYMRMKYPNTIHGALSSSAPLRWVAGIGDFEKFFETISRDYFLVNSLCPSIVQKAYKIMRDSARVGNYSIINKGLSLCNLINSTAELDYVERWLRNGFVMLAMMDYPYKASFMGNLPAFPVNVSCQRLVKYQNNPVEALLKASAVFYGENLKCYDYKKLYIECSDITGCGLGPDSMAWDFQACTEMSLFDRGQSSENNMFPDMPFNSTIVAKYCLKRWPVERPKDQLKLLQWGGGLSQATNIVFANGDLDPWGLGGINPDEKLPASSISVIVQGGAHHLDLRESNKADPDSVKLVRATQQKYITMWLHQ